MENLIKMDDLGVPLFLETPISFVDPLDILGSLIYLICVDDVKLPSATPKSLPVSSPYRQSI